MCTSAPARPVSSRGLAWGVAWQSQADAPYPRQSSGCISWCRSQAGKSPCRWRSSTGSVSQNAAPRPIRRLRANPDRRAGVPKAVRFRARRIQAAVCLLCAPPIPGRRSPVRLFWLVFRYPSCSTLRDLAQCFNQIVNLGLGVRLRHRDQHLPGSVWIVLAQVIAADDMVVFQQRRIDLVYRARAGDDELLKEGQRRIDTEAGQFGDLLCRIVRLLVAQFGHAAQAMLAHQRQVDAAGQRQQALVGANVAGRLLAPDVLFAGPQRHDVGPAAIGVHRLAHDAACDPAYKLILRGKKAQVWPAKTERNAQALPLADNDVCAEFAGRLEQTE